MASAAENVLTPDQISQFMTNGYVKIPQAFSKEDAAHWTKDVWTRLGMSPTDKSTWTSYKINMPSHRTIPLSTFSPRAHSAICALLGGASRISPTVYSGPHGQRAPGLSWNDGFIVNLGSPEYEGRTDIDPRTLGNWHIDGDFFTHFLDSPEQGLLVIPCWTDILPGGGGTFVCPEGMRRIAQYLYAHPQGLLPRMSPTDDPTRYSGLEFYDDLIKDLPASAFHEMTGEAGDVILLHPLMMHSASKNPRRLVRIITNPPVSLAEPFCFDRKSEGGEYSLVELKTLEMLGRDGRKGEGLEGWKVTGERKEVVPERLKVQAEMRRKELERLGKDGGAEVGVKEVVGVES
ncbi:MAG: hypothetical protein Q9227_009380 [Pyrenula ochraceoflavens]